jgi:type II secretory pathway component PulF
MTHPMHSDSDNLAAFVRSNVFAWAIFSSGLGIVVAAFFSYITPMFEEMHKGLGSDVPSLTMFVIRSHQALWVMPAISAAVSCVAMWRESATANPGGRTILFLAVWSVLTLALGAAALMSLYAPVRAMSAIV